MFELMSIYTAFCLAAAGTLAEPDGFMPFQHNYWFWKVIGFGGLIIFQARWVVQWLHSEKHKESRSPDRLLVAVAGRGAARTGVLPPPAGLGRRLRVTSSAASPTPAT